MPTMRRHSPCQGCFFTKDCGGFRDRERRCPEWAAKDPRSKYHPATCPECGGVLDSQGYHFHGHCHPVEQEALS